MKTSPTSIKLDGSIKARVKKLAETKQRSSHWLMREAIKQYVEREERRETYKQEALEAWQNYQETGLHATSKEVLGWLESWGTEDEGPAPECHS
ncbi:CopG family ribbon-helix-helix protein [Desulfovibrio sp. JC010]|uniref:CopG family ribbon-helix-helix protein n=1 Tax=Desulfovibrio sp. JC010 TaxID=2593641 RepID=UPI0013D67D60|nr:CopG family ribbon-helix-helix protein [Desulfovibrio sp. JC010]NDV26778.1 ribbon-helix-helix protein, CopG family [Desulfovibrio sp. JC010]